MRLVWSTALLLAAACAGPRPYAVAIESEPWSLGEIVSDNPRFVLYDDGTVIYLREGHWNAPEYATVRLDAERNAALRETFRAVAGVAPVTNLSDMVHEPMYLLQLRTEDGWAAASVNGDIVHNAAQRGAAPEAFRRAWDAARTFDDERATPWRPESLEVLLSVTEPGDEPTVPWPEGWPGFDAARRDENASSLYRLDLDGTRLGELQALRARTDMNHLVRIDGKVAMLAYRVRFPSERSWCEAR